ncbi:MAG: endonuclease III [Ignavibacteriaceae bacterium]
MTSKSEIVHAKKIFSILKKEYPSVKPALNYKNAFELVIATILSAQCTDARVNIVSESLFKKYKTPGDFFKLTNEELEKDIHSTGFYRQKAKSIKESSKILIEKYGGQVPADFDALANLPGVGRKTASVIAGNAFGIPTIAVDTHVKRLSNLLGFINSDNPEKIEMKLKELLPVGDWINSSHYLAAHGRKVCIARRPHCLLCVLADECPSFNPESK